MNGVLRNNSINPQAKTDYTVNTWQTFFHVQKYFLYRKIKKHSDSLNKFVETYMQAEMKFSNLKMGDKLRNFYLFL